MHLRRGAFDEIDWVPDVLRRIAEAKSPMLVCDEYAGGLLDPRVSQLLDPLLQRVSRLLCLPVSQPADFPVDPDHPFTSLSSIMTTVAAECLDITGTPSPFDSDYLLKLRQFEAAAWKEAAAEYHPRVVAARNPAAPKPLTLLPSTSAAMAILRRLKTNVAHNRATANDNPTHYAMIAAFQAGMLGERRC